MSWPLVLPPTLEPRHAELRARIDAGLARVVRFASTFGWGEHVAESFFDSAEVFDRKDAFDARLLALAGFPGTTVLPPTAVGALEARVLVLVAPDRYDEIYPEGRVDETPWEKLVAHEIGHRLHIRLLRGDEEAMGPVWFYEGFAIVVADQFASDADRPSPEEVRAIVTASERGSYRRYRGVMRWLLDRVSLPELVSRAGAPKFVDEVVGLTEP